MQRDAGCPRDIGMLGASGMCRRMLGALGMCRDADTPGIQQCWVPRGCTDVGFPRGDGCLSNAGRCLSIPAMCRDVGCCAHVQYSPCPTLDGLKPLFAHVWGPRTGKGESSWVHWGSRPVRRHRWQLSWSDGDHNPPHGFHYHLYLVKKLSSWMCLILITPYHTGPLQTGQTDRQGLLLHCISAQAAPSLGGGGKRPPLCS